MTYHTKGWNRGNFPSKSPRSFSINKSAVERTGIVKVSYLLYNYDF